MVLRVRQFRPIIIRLVEVNQPKVRAIMVSSRLLSRDLRSLVAVDWLEILLGGVYVIAGYGC